MKKSLLVKLVILLLTTASLSGCLLVPVGDGHFSEGGRGGGHGGGGHGGGHGDD